MFSFLCLYLHLSQAQFLRARWSAEPPPHVRHPSEAFRCIFTAQRWKRELKQACKDLFTLQCLVFCFAKELKMLSVTMDTCLHWNCCRCYKWNQIAAVAKLISTESPWDVNLDFLVRRAAASTVPSSHPQMVTLDPRLQDGASHPANLEVSVNSLLPPDLRNIEEFWLIFTLIIKHTPCQRRLEWVKQKRGITVFLV